MKILEYDEIDPLGAFEVSMLALDFALTPSLAAHIRESDPRPFPFLALYAVEADQVLGKLQEQGSLSGDLGRLAAEVALGSRNRNRSLELARQAVPRDSPDFRDHLWLGQILWLLDERGEAEASFRRAVELAPTVLDSWVALVLYYRRIEQPSKAEAILADIAASRPGYAGLSYAKIGALGCPIAQERS